MAYKNNTIRTSDAYQVTINTKNDEMLIALKNTIAKYNVLNKEEFVNGGVESEFLRVCVKPRGPRTSSFYHTLTKDATHFDVYVQKDYCRDSALKWSRAAR
jgi:hypothetical protein